MVVGVSVSLHISVVLGAKGSQDTTIWSAQEKHLAVAVQREVLNT